jgi:colanic acid biosynthesis glycosyl transferase WcaI
VPALHIAIIGLHYAPEPSGNAPYTTALAEGLAGRGHRVDVLTGLPHYPTWRIFPGYGAWRSTSKHDTLAVSHLRHYVPTVPTSAKRIVMETSFGLRAAASRWHRPDVVLAVTPALLSTAVVGLRAKFGVHRPPVGVWVQDLYSQGVLETGVGGRRVAGGAQRLESSILRSAQGVAVVHDHFRERVVADLGVEPGRVRVIRNWTHLQPVPQEPAASTRDRFGWGATETVVLHAGNMGVKQGLENVVEAARLADRTEAPVRFVMLGDGNQRPALERLAQGVRSIEFIDSLPDGEFQSALGAADVLLVNEKPGVGAMSVPSKLTSYFHAVRPVLAASEPDSTTAAELAASGAGWRVDTGDPDALLGAAMKLGADADEARRMGEQGLAYARNVLSEDAAITAHEAWLQDLVRTSTDKRGS